MRNKIHDKKRILKAIHEYETTNLSNTEVINKHKCDRNAFFYYLRQKRENDKNSTQNNKQNDTTKEHDTIEQHGGIIIETPEGKVKEIQISSRSQKDINRHLESQTSEIKKKTPTRLDIDNMSKNIMVYSKIN